LFFIQALLCLGELVNRQARPRLVLSEVADRLTLVVARHVESAVDQRQRRPVVANLDLDVLGVLEQLALEVPADLWLGVAGEQRLELGPHALLDPHLLGFANEFRSLFSGCKPSLDLLHFCQPFWLPVLSTVDEVAFDVVLQDGAVVVLPLLDNEACRGVRLSHLVPSDHLDLSTVGFATFGDVKMPHPIVDQLVLASVDDSVAVDEPHYSGLGVSGHPAAEAGASSDRGGDRLRFCHEARLELFDLLVDELRSALPS